MNNKTFRISALTACGVLLGACISAFSELEDAATRVALGLRHQYGLGYTSTNQRRGGKWRKIRVSVNHSAWAAELIALTRDGYYAAPF